MKNNLFLLKVMILLLNVFFIKNSFGQPLCAKSPKPTYFIDNGSFPRGASSYCEDQLEVQGVTHDDLPATPNWYITSTDRTGTIDNAIDNAYIFKIPVTENLQQIDVFHNPHVKYKSLNDYPALWSPYPCLLPWGCNRRTQGYVHWGDLDHYTYNHVEYLIVPMTSPTASRSPNRLAWGDPAVFIFRASDLSLVGYGLLPSTNGKGQKDVGWCAVNPKTGYLFTSPDRTSKIIKYKIPWNLLQGSGYKGRVTLTYITYYKLKTAKNETLDLHNMQGGEFTPNGELLYLSNGSGHCKGQGPSDAGQPTDGIHVIDATTTTNWKEIKHSYNRMYASPGESNCCKPYKDPMDFTYDFSCGKFEAHSEQPEGLTIFDIDKLKKHDSHISGQLHVMVASVGLVGNQGWMEHYSNKLYVDEEKGSTPVWGTPFPGTKQKPFKSVAAAVHWYPAWEGAQILIKTANETKPSIMTMEGIVGYKITHVPASLKQGQYLPTLDLVLYNYSGKNIARIISVDFLLSADPITPDLNTTNNYIKIGTFNHYVHLTPFAMQTFHVTGLKAPCKTGSYYIGTSAYCGPVSSPGNPSLIKIIADNSLNANAGPDKTIDAQGDLVELNGSSTTPGAIFNWTASNGGNIVSGSSSPTVTVNATGTYKLRITKGSTGCSIEDKAIVRLTSLMEIPSDSDSAIATEPDTTFDSKSDPPVAGVVDWGQDELDVARDSVKVYITELKRNPVTDIPPAVKVYPNPASGKLNVLFDTKIKTKYAIRLFDATGKAVFIKQGDSNEGSNKVEINIQGFSNGLYILNVTADNMNNSTKVIIQQ